MLLPQPAHPLGHELAPRPTDNIADKKELQHIPKLTKKTRAESENEALRRGPPGWWYRLSIKLRMPVRI
jgi:hypothetical protein